MNKAKKLKLNKETLSVVTGGALHRNTGRCHQTLATFCYSECGPAFCDPTQAETCGPSEGSDCSAYCTPESHTCRSEDTCFC